MRGDQFGAFLDIAASTDSQPGTSGDTEPVVLQRRGCKSGWGSPTTSSGSVGDQQSTERQIGELCNQENRKLAMVSGEHANDEVNGCQGWESKHPTLKLTDVSTREYN